MTFRPVKQLQHRALTENQLLSARGLIVPF